MGLGCEPGVAKVPRRMFFGLVQMVEQLVYSLVAVEFSSGFLGSASGFLCRDRAWVGSLCRLVLKGPIYEP